MKWQPIETAPREEDQILLGALDGETWPMEWSDYAGGWISANCEPAHVRSQKPTHWMPLPEPPSE